MHLPYQIFYLDASRLITLKLYQNVQIIHRAFENVQRIFTKRLFDKFNINYLNNNGRLRILMLYLLSHCRLRLNVVLV